MNLGLIEVLLSGQLSVHPGMTPYLNAYQVSGLAGVRLRFSWQTATLFTLSSVS